ncbi:MAG TPA: MFS transporter [Herpetosiphonaceae bacterium]
MSKQSQLETHDTAQTAITFNTEEFKESIEPQKDPQNKPAKSQTVSYRQLLSNPNFRRLWLGQSISTFGSYFTRVAIPIYVYRVTGGSYTHLGLSFFASLLPPLLFGLLAGALVDRWDRRRTMIVTDLLNIVLLCALIATVLLPLGSLVQLGALYTITFLSSALHQIFHPARIAIFTEVVSDDELLSANSLDQSTTSLGELMSYPLAAIVLGYFGPAIAFGIDAVSFLLSALLIWRVKVRSTPPETRANTNILSEIADGLATINKLPLLRKLAILSLIVPLTLSLLATLQLPFAVEMLGSTEAVGYSTLEGATVFGLLIGTLLLGRFGQHITRWKLLASGIISYGAAVTVVGLVPDIGFYLSLPAKTEGNPWTPLLLLAMPFVFLQGAANSLIYTSIRTMQQEHSPRAMLGRVSSTISVAASVGWSTGALLTWLGEGRINTMIITIGIIIFVIGVLSLRWLRVPPVEPQPTAKQAVPEQSF